MITRIAHLADIHLRKSPTRNNEYTHVFDNLIKSLRKEKPDRIVIVGDIVHDYLALGTEQVILARNLLSELSDIAPVIITRGNHDCLKKNLKRKDSIEAITSGLSKTNIHYYSDTGFYVDENVTWAVWHHGSKIINPWNTKRGKEVIKERKTDKRIYIDLFHDKIKNSFTPSGFEITGDHLFSVADFRGDYSFLGDIHLMQYLNNEKTKAYSGSPIAQDFGEADSFHGYLLWNIIKGPNSTEEIELENKYHKYVNVKVNENTDFDSLNFKLDSTVENISLRIIWETLPATRNKDNEQKIRKYVKNQHENVRIYNKNVFIDSENIEVKDKEKIKNISHPEVQHEIFREFLKKLGVTDSQISDVIKLDNEVLKQFEEQIVETYEWDVVKFGATNFMSYEKFDIDWSEKNGLFQILGKNTAGKTTLVFKFIPFMLFGKTLETETRKKHGDLRFINNRNGADYTEGYLILDINGDFYGIKKETRIQKNKEGSVTGVPSTITYHQLASPDDELTDANNIDTLDENRKSSIEKIITSVVGSYDNFMRVVLTTSDTLNRVLSNDMAEFIDSLLFDSGLDIFDKKLTIAKKIEKKYNEKGRITCDVEEKTNQIDEYGNKIKIIESEITKIEDEDLKELKDDLEDENIKLERLNKKLHTINEEIYNLDVEETQKTINSNNKVISENEETIEVLKEANKTLPDNYDEKRLKILEDKKANHKETESQFKLQIRDFNADIEKHRHSIEITNYHISTLKQKGKELKQKVLTLRNNKVCGECGQELTAEHKKHISQKIEELIKEMHKIKDEIDEKKDLDIKKYNKKIEETKNKIAETEDKIEELNLEMEDVLSEYGILLNNKNDVDKKEKNHGQINLLQVENENMRMKNTILQKKIDEYEDSLAKIEENKSTNSEIDGIKENIIKINDQKTLIQNMVMEKKTEINNLKYKIDDLNELIAKFKKQTYRDEIFSYYKKCVHRDGVPKQLLINSVIPRINVFMSELLSETPFTMWLDETTLIPKFRHTDKPDSTIDCISGSGKERTYSSVVLKFALNQINIKSKPKIFMMDEIMGKLDDDGVEEFIQITQIIKRYMNRVIVVEHTHNIIPDYLIDVTLNENDLSEALLIDN